APAVRQATSARAVFMNNLQRCPLTLWNSCDYSAVYSRTAVCVRRAVLCGGAKRFYGRRMVRLLSIACALIVLAATNATAMAETRARIAADGVIVCPASPDDRTPPTFDAGECKTMPVWDVDPQNAFIWVKGKIALDATEGANGEPLALYVLGKMSSEFYINGVYVGANGTPGPDRASETPGRMDAVLFPPQSIFRRGDNEVVFRASSHRGLIRLGNPIHGIMIAPAGDVADATLRRYWPSTLTLGLFLAGALYFAITGFRGMARKRAFTFSLICAFAGGQLMSEISRGLVAYAYPMHDLRLLLITTFSAGFGLSVAYHVFDAFRAKRTPALMIALAALTLISIVATPGFDQKAALAIVLPLLAALIATGFWSFKRRPRAFAYFLSLLVFVGANIAFPNIFLDVVFFYLVAAFLLFLFAEQGVALAREAEQRRVEQARANRLELALDQAKEREEATTISIKSAGKVERICAEQIAHCRGAGGYCEIILEGGREVLHAATLAEMEQALPSTFLRVHRSHLVNIAFVKSLHRDPAGTGMLVLSDGSQTPVSRRIMPKVRRALSEG
ncbi:MAG: LytTR family DNA-binding domain-containing protein, partial [Pseudomonadota bacterium]